MGHFRSGIILVQVILRGGGGNCRGVISGFFLGGGHFRGLVT